jgi:hypothetical protein
MRSRRTLSEPGQRSTSRAPTQNSGTR